MAKEKGYTEAVGRRKTASARVRLTSAKSSSMVVNDRPADEYFPLEAMRRMAFAPLQVLGVSYAVSAHVRGGGLKAQAEAIRLGISRVLVELNPEQRKDLKIRGFLRRDPRARERKKFGLKGARRAPQWSKR